ncbi:hypothetical protein O181_001701 [Austropuccinia psidii MF-1]|uniref:Integrase catalytic domain-containing protein n=1 Tax=Austropuccinia psidii MF-1 TaxID=1389203 RepID=A0A9Q3BAQ7_9BASI|nr:hypothetical protein [Austropuccinia psidii MF-1]
MLQNIARVVEIAHMDWVRYSTPGGDRSFNECLVSADRHSKALMFLPFHKDDTAMETAIMIWNRVISLKGLLQNTISDKYTKFTSGLWKNLYNLFGTKISFSKAYNSQTDQLEERIIQSLEEMNRIFSDYGLELKDSDGFTHDLCTLIPALELAYKKSIN